MHEIYGEAKQKLNFTHKNLGLVYSIINTCVSDAIRQRFGAYYGFYFVIDSIIEKIKSEGRTDIKINTVDIITDTELPKEVNCKYRYC